MTNPCDAPCPKCGSADIYRVFHARGSRVKNSDFGVPKHPGFNVAMTGWESYARNDCIVHHCRTCQYEWTGKPLKKAKAKPPTERGSRPVKWDCGPARQERYESYHNWRANWHRWFAWRPVRVGSHDCRWLEWVERKSRYECGYEGCYWINEYRPTTAGKVEGKK